MSYPTSSQKRAVTTIFGGFPCPAYSEANLDRKGDTDPRSFLMYETMVIVFEDPHFNYNKGGNLLSLGSSSFLVGPAKQCRDMLAPERFLASAIYFATLFGTLFSAFWLKIQIVTFAFVLVQFAALTWYMLSYVPYGQACLKRTVKKVIS